MSRRRRVFAPLPSKMGEGGVRASRSPLSSRPAFAVDCGPASPEERVAVAVGVRRRRARGGSGRLLAAAGLAAGLSVVGTASPLGDFLERELGQVVVLRLRGPVEPPPGVAVVAQDYASAEALGLPAKLGGWPRGLLARAIRNATAAGAQAVALDLVLDTARPGGRRDLAAALRESRRVVLFESMRQEARPVGPGAMTLVRERAIPPLPAFAAAAETRRRSRCRATARGSRDSGRSSRVPKAGRPCRQRPCWRRRSPSRAGAKPWPPGPKGWASRVPPACSATPPCRTRLWRARCVRRCSPSPRRRSGSRRDRRPCGC